VQVYGAGNLEFCADGGAYPSKVPSAYAPAQVFDLLASYVGG